MKPEIFTIEMAREVITKDLFEPDGWAILPVEDGSIDVDWERREEDGDTIYTFSNAMFSPDSGEAVFIPMERNNCPLFKGGMDVRRSEV